MVSLVAGRHGSSLTGCRALKWACMTDHRVGRNRADVSDDINEDRDDYSDQ